MNGNESDGSAEWGDATSPNQRATSEIEITEKISAPPPADNGVGATVTDDPLDIDITEQLVVPRQEPAGPLPVPLAAAAPRSEPDAPSPETTRSDSTQPVAPPPLDGAFQETAPSALSPASGAPPVDALVGGLTNAPPGRPPRSGSQRSTVVIAGVAAVSIVLVGVLVALFWPNSGPTRPVAASSAAGGTASSGPAVPAAPSAPSVPSGSPGTETAPSASGTQPAVPGGQSAPPSAAVPASPGGAQSGAGGTSQPVQNGSALRYQTVQQEQGYFEGILTITNQTGAPMNTWELSFTYPGANVKNIWEAVLVRTGGYPVIRSGQNAEVIPPGGSLQVRFGAAGIPSAPQNCLLNGRACHFL